MHCLPIQRTCRLKTDPFLFYSVHYPMIGAMTAVDTLLATAHGAGLPKAYGEYTQVGMVFVTIACVPVGITMLFVEPILVAIDQDLFLAELAGRFCKHLTWGLFPYYWVQVLTKYLQAQHVLLPPVYVGLVANAMNVFLNWLLIFNLNWGFDGAPIATGLCRWFQLFLLAGYLSISTREQNRPTRPRTGGFFLLGKGGIMGSGTQSGTLGTTLGTTMVTTMSTNTGTTVGTAMGSTMGTTHDYATGTTDGCNPLLARLKALSPTFLALAGPGAAMMAIEAWAFEVTTLLAGYLGTVALDAHLTMLQLATLAFLSLPFAVAIAATIRVGNLLGAGDAKGAGDASKVSFAICFAFSGVCALVFSLTRNSLGYIFTHDKEVVRAVAKIAPIAALFQLADGGQAAAGGVFRGMGRQTTVAVRNFFGFWCGAFPITTHRLCDCPYQTDTFFFRARVFGMPVGAILTFAVGGYGVAGLWWGLTVGLIAVLVVSLVQLLYVNWEKEVANAKHRVSEGEVFAGDVLRRVSIGEWPVWSGEEDNNTV